MADVKQILERMLRTKDLLEEDIASLINSQKLRIATCQHTWNPSGDSIWAFKMRGVGQIKVPDFISSFCDNPYFQEYNDSNDDVSIYPIGLYDNTGELRNVSSQALEGLEKLFKDKKWWDEEYHMNPSKVGKNLEKTVYGKSDLKGSIIFRGSGNFTTITEIEKFLSGLGVLDFDVLVNTVHFNVLGERVTVLEYD